MAETPKYTLCRESPWWPAEARTVRSACRIRPRRAAQVRHPAETRRCRTECRSLSADDLQGEASRLSRNLALRADPERAMTAGPPRVAAGARPVARPLPLPRYSGSIVQAPYFDRGGWRCRAPEKTPPTSLAADAAHAAPVVAAPGHRRQTGTGARSYWADRLIFRPRRRQHHERGKVLRRAAISCTIEDTLPHRICPTSQGRRTRPRTRCSSAGPRIFRSRSRRMVGQEIEAGDQAEAALSSRCRAAAAGRVSADYSFWPVRSIRAAGAIATGTKRSGRTTTRRRGYVAGRILSVESICR